ncbi:MAG TPA: hypothetical protein VJZ02_03855 [Candidatus Brocadiales bacterium]|nr:hypothetical protein [Candidatus Brocadiales bacterium]
MEWNVSKGSGRCTSCERVFQEEECFFSTLCLETECLLRKDFCLGCWSGEAAAVSSPSESATPDKKGQNPEVFFSFWKTRMPKKEEPRRRIVDNAVILNLFSRLQGVTELWAKNMQYVLGLFLRRKKLLKLKEQGKDEQGDFVCLYSPEEDKTYQVYNSNLTEEEIEKINDDVLRLLDPAGGQTAFLPLEQTPVDSSQ